MPQQSLMSISLNACGPTPEKCSIKISLTDPAPGTTSRHVRIADATDTVVYETDIAANVIGFVLTDLSEPNTFSGVVTDTGSFGTTSGPPCSCPVKCVLTPVDPTNTPSDPYKPQ